MSLQLSYCGQDLRLHDPDRFLITLLLPASVREALWALFAFNYEIAKTREVVTETQLGLIRLQWWREGIDEIYAGKSVREHAVLLALQDVIQAYDLPKEHFERLIYAREFDLEDVLPANLEGLINYADFTTTPLFRLAVKITGDDVDDEMVRAVAVNYALSGLLRAVAFHARQRRCYLPEDLLQMYGVKPSQLYEFKPQEGLSGVLEAVCAEIQADLRPKNKFLALSQALALMNQQHIVKCGYNPLHPKAFIPVAFKEIRLFWASLFV